MNEKKGLKIGLAFSGGGYRATSFSLGVLTYLDKIKIDEENLLQKVVVLSTTSGGTIAGTRYAIGIKRNEKLTEIYKSVYSFMTDVDLIGLGLDRLISNEGWHNKRVKSLINALADVYDEHLLSKAKFGDLLTDDNPIHLKHISFNATEFANALQFRFQHTEKIDMPKKYEPERGIIGNHYYRIPEIIAKEIRMADILAASSCFPGGFEPINFPDDFVLPNTNFFLDFGKQEGYPVGLMDGGIVDNQGVEPILLAEERMKRNLYKDDTIQNQTNVLDLIIISDVDSPYMEDYKASTQRSKNWWRKLTPLSIFIINTLVLLISLLFIGKFSRDRNVLLLILTSVIMTLNFVIYFIAKFLGTLPEKFEVPKLFMKPLGKLLKLKLLVYENLIMNRAKSLLKMANDVFLKHIRRLNYNKIYDAKTWENRRIMNAIYELRKGEEKLNKKIEDGTISKDLIPSSKIQDVATIAASMGTTLWFTREELSRQNMLKSIIACGQFTTCWNLLEYIRKLKKDSHNTGENHMHLITCENQLTKDWERFNDDPYWMVNEINKKTGVKYNVDTI